MLVHSVWMGPVIILAAGGKGRGQSSDLWQTITHEFTQSFQQWCVLHPYSHVWDPCMCHWLKGWRHSSTLSLGEEKLRGSFTENCPQAKTGFLALTQKRILGQFQYKAELGWLKEIWCSFKHRGWRKERCLGRKNAPKVRVWTSLRDSKQICHLVTLLPP